ncbi:DDB1- and CUL4-associated factor 11 [Anopheles nili]|uniref:DDB1- and CUL4-associated factor 11 n=1 Tax=Anopheles nili TaxID=185578 RepID=UPI00237AD4FB|nr:DDB1- and CUL4-associated factor 11 [Anopheles nili]
MGNTTLRSTFLRTMSELESSGDDDFSEYALLHERVLNDIQLPSDEDDTTENEFASILRHLINSGEIMVLNHENSIHHPLPVIKKKPNLDKLKKNDVYHYTKSASGLTSMDSSKKDGSFSLVRMIGDRQRGLGKRKGSFMRSDLCRINNLYRPNVCTETVDMCDTKVFCGRYTSNGDRFVTASQDTLVRVYDSSRNKYRLLRTLDTKHVSWSILDIDFSPDGNSFVYSTWADALFISSLDRDVSDPIHSLFLQPNNQKLGVFTVRYSSCGNHVLCGANDGSLYVYDLTANRRTLVAPVARVDMDVNSVGFVDETSNIFFSGSDDGMIKLWDRRCLNESNTEAVGKLIGHYDGITYIDSRNDGRYIISNSKDQSIKMWDLRKMSPSNARPEPLQHNWDYRWDDVPKRFFNATKQMIADTSIMTYRGHKVQKSLIRARFSPAETTGQRYIYTGCGTGRLIVYDVLTGAIVEAIASHYDIVRDVAWHPSRTEIVTCSWDCTVHRHLYCSPAEKQEHKEAMQGLKSRLKTRFSDDDDTDDDEGRQESRPLRRSRRLAERNNSGGAGGSSTSSASGSNSTNNSTINTRATSRASRSSRNSTRSRSLSMTMRSSTRRHS